MKTYDIAGSDVQQGDKILLMGFVHKVIRKREAPRLWPWRQYELLVQAIGDTSLGIPAEPSYLDICGDDVIKRLEES